MSLDNTTADALAASICSSLSITDAAAKNKWKTICRAFYSSGDGIADNLVVILQALTVVTTGGPTTQTGPAAPVTLDVS